MEGEIAAGLAVALSALPSHKVASLGPLPNMTLPAWHGPSVGLSGLQSPVLEFARRAAPGDRALHGSPIGQC